MKKEECEGRGERGQLLHQNAPMRGADPFGEHIVAGYFDQMTLCMKWIGGTMENMMQQFNVSQPLHLGDHYPVCPTWSDYKTRRGDGAGPSRTHEEEGNH